MIRVQDKSINLFTQPAYDALVDFSNIKDLTLLLEDKQLYISKTKTIGDLA